MAHSHNQFRRGQVWYVDDNYKALGSIQGKSRPYLVVSNDLCNKHSPVIHMAPLTSQNKKNNQPTHVKFFNPRMKQDNWILLEQVMPKSVPDIENVSTYHYTLSNDVMAEVDKAIAIQFGIRSFGIDTSEFEVLLDMVVEQKIAQINESTQSMLDARVSRYVETLLDKVANAGKIPEPEEYQPGDDVLQLVQELPTAAEVEDDTSEKQHDSDGEDVAGVLTIPEGVSETSFEQSSEPVSTPEDTQETPNDQKSQTHVPVVDSGKPKSARSKDRKSAIDKFNAKWGTTNTSTSEDKKLDSNSSAPETIVITRPEISYTKSGRIRWTDELKRQFLDDVGCYDIDKVGELWDIEKPCIYSYKYKFTKDLANKSAPTKESTPEENSEPTNVSDVGTAPEPEVTKPKRKGRPSKVREIPDDATRAAMLSDYDSMPLSRFMRKYKIYSKAKAVELAAQLRTK